MNAPSVPHFERQIRNLKQKSYRVSRKARESLEAWFSKLGTVEDILDFEKYAIEQQKVVRQLTGLENELAEILKQ
jgi:hypothetical protein